jgi:hypothetical protein
MVDFRIMMLMSTNARRASGRRDPRYAGHKTSAAHDVSERPGGGEDDRGIHVSIHAMHVSHGYTNPIAMEFMRHEEPRMPRPLENV